MLRFANIHSLSDFRQNSKDFIEKMKSSGSPLVLTINGRAEIIVCESSTFQDLLDELTDVKEELARLKAAASPPELPPKSGKKA
jgi:PHD/YefM family antitoxin component YafN of YafNO toxin-antitoxin module